MAMAALVVMQGLRATVLRAKGRDLLANPLVMAVMVATLALPDWAEPQDQAWVLPALLVQTEPK
jgi:hypothetical protein